MLDSSPTIHHFTLDYPIGIVGVHPIHLHQLREVLHLPTHPLLLLTSSVLKKSDARIPIPSITRLDYTISTHCIASWLSSHPRHISRKWMGIVIAFLMGDHTGCVGDALTGQRLCVPFIVFKTEYISCRGGH